MKNKPKIGFSTKTLKHKTNWADYVKDLNLKTVEINKAITRIRFDIGWLAKLKKKLNGLDLSMHSELVRLFEKGSKEYIVGQLEVLKLEVLSCEMLGVKELIFHLKQEKLNKSETKKIRGIIKFANKHKVDLVYESNSNFIGDVCIDNLRKFPGLRYNLDLGHLNMSLAQGTLGYELDDFLPKIRKRITYLHAHNNNGISDQHTCLKKGTLDWKHVFDILDMRRIKKIIIEQHDRKDILSTKKDLEDYFRKRTKIKKRKNIINN